MALLDRLTGRREPAAGTVRRAPDDVVRALVSLNGPDVAFTVREAVLEASEKGADLVAEWRMTEPAWYSVCEREQVSRTVRVLMRLDQRKGEVRGVDEQVEVTWTHGVPTLTAAMNRQRGIVFESTGRKSFDLGPGGSDAATDVFRFSSEELKQPLRSVVLRCGWTWRPLAFGTL